MKKLLLIVILSMFTSLSFAQDRVSIRVEFKKALWTCPVCGLEEIEDRPVGGGASYEHTCKNGHKFNQSGANMKEYNGCLQYPKDTFEEVKQEDIDKEKQERYDAWLYEVKHPAPYVEPSIEDHNQMVKGKEEELARQKEQRAEAIRKLNEKAWAEGGTFLDPETGEFAGIKIID